MLFRTRQDESTVWRRFRSGSDGFTFTQEADHYEAHVAATAERVVDLFRSLSEHLPPAVDVVMDDRRTGRVWSGESIALPDLRDAVARLKVPLATYGGLEISAYSPEDQLSITPDLELYAYSRSDRWAYLLQSHGLEEYGQLADKPWRIGSWDRAPAPALTDAVAAAAERIGLTQA
ncbi:hypothetical protein BH23GEM2_BH23GEM2_08230 [soil metagenome]